MNMGRILPQRRDEAPMYPLFLKLDGRRCVVVGGGPIGAMKARDLLRCGGFVEVVSPTLSADWDALVAVWGDRVHHEARGFEEGDVDTCLLVFSATGDEAVDAQVRRAAERRSVLCNVVDVPDRCDFYAASVVRSGPVTVAIGTQGASPSIAVVLRERLERMLTPALGHLAETLGDRRAELLTRFPAYRDRADRLHAASSVFLRAVVDEGREPSRDDLHAWVDRILACDRPCKGECACAAAALEATYATPEAL